MRSIRFRALLVCAALAAVFVQGDTLRAVSSTVVISEFRVRGPNGAADEFVELFNVSSSPVDISGWKISGSNNAGSVSARATIPANTTIGAGCFYLVTNSSTSGGPYSGPVPGNLTFATGITDDGGIGLLNPANVAIDQVGMSNGSAYKEGTVLVSLGSSNLNRGYERKPGGAAGNGTDTDDNASDFQQITPSNPQNASSTCIGGPPQSTNPSGTMTANALNYSVGDPITLTVNVTPGTNPASIGISVTGNLAPINLGNPAFVDQGGNVFSFTGTIPIGVSGGSKSLTATITDGNSPPRTGTTSPATQITILAPTPPTGSGSANPASVPAGGTTQLTVNVTPGTNPTSSGLAVTGNLSAIGGGAVQPFQLVSGNTFTVSATVAPGTPFGSTALPITVSDDQGRSSSFSLPVIVTPPGAGIVRINEMDADTPGTDAAEFVELYDGGIGNTPLNGMVVVFFEGDSATSYAAFDLDGYSTDANGYFVLGNVPGAGLIIDPGAFGMLSNGPDAVALYVGDASAFPNGTNATTTSLQDAIVYGTDDPIASGLLPLLNAGQKIVNENATGNGTTQSSQRCPNGMGGFRNTSTYYPGTPTPGAASSCPAPRPPSDVVISQIYGGGGNTGATYRNDFVELFNRGAAPVDLTGWSLQYASSTGNGWGSNLQPLGGSIGNGEYYLVALGSGGAIGASLPPANISGLINMAAGSGKIALVNSFDELVGGCPIYDPSIMDFVGYGSGADCGEGGTTTATGSNTAALYRKGNGSVDTDNNASDFNAPATLPIPRQTEPIIELGPLVLSRDPRVNGFNAPRDATIQVIFTEPVTAESGWFNLTCAGSGQHTSATFASSFGGQDHFVTPNDNFIAGEQCTFTILKDRVHDVDLDDVGPNTDTLPVDVSWSFTVANGAAPAYPSSVHLTMGNPSNAGSNPSNYLMDKPEFTVSYNRDLGRPNWVSWHLSDEWIGTLTRVDTFRPDPQIPPDWYRVQSFDFSGSGFDRGHMTPNADRDKETSVPINQATFLMSNMIAQAPGNNQGPWANLEAYLRTLVEQDGSELYIVSGAAGVGGSGSLRDANNQPFVTTTLADGHVTVPASTWKVALVLPKGADDLSRVGCLTRTIAVIMPNQDTIRPDPWQNYLTTIDAVETLTGYDLFSNLPVPFQNCIEPRRDGDPPLDLVKGDQTITFAAPANPTYGDAPFTVSATGGASGNPVTFVASGVCTSGGFNGATITIVSAGPCTITASQAGSAAYNAAADVAHTVTVNKAVPSFSGLSSPVIEAGTPTVTLSGIVSLGALAPTGSVTITLNGVSQTVAVGTGGHFSASFVTASLAPATAPYPVAYVYSGDTNFTSTAGTGSVTVTDTTAPSIGSVSASQSVLSPPNHKMIDITIGYQVAEFTGAPVCALSVSSNEAVNGQDDGNTSADWQVLDAHRVQLRSERAGDGNGRIYTITIRCTDPSGNIGSATTTVSVPK
jgi:endonuclease G, mitochondrial